MICDANAAPWSMSVHHCSLKNCAFLSYCGPITLCYSSSVQSYEELMQLGYHN